MVGTTLDQRLYARSFPTHRRIEISALTREYLRTLNLIIWTYVFAVSEEVIALEDVEKIQLLEQVLPYLLSLYRDINFSRLPIMRARSASVLHMAIQTTHIQLTFLLAHEYAHMLLHGEVLPSSAAEFEADKFAYELLMKLPWSYESGDIWTAIRWLFRMIVLERITGAILYGGRVDWDQEAVLAREHMMLPYFKDKPPSRQDNLLEITGTYLIMHARGDLHVKRGAMATCVR